MLALRVRRGPSRTYRLSQNVKPLIWVECSVDKHSRSRIEYLVKARSQFKERSNATNVEISLPLPPDAITPTVRTSQVGLRLNATRIYFWDMSEYFLAFVFGLSSQGTSRSSSRGWSAMKASFWRVLAAGNMSKG